MAGLVAQPGQQVDAEGLAPGGDEVDMVDAAREPLPEGILFDAVVETGKCLPDAVQLLTPPSYGNGWMRVVNLGRYALSFYDKLTGEGYRAWLDPKTLEAWPEIRAWYLKTKPKKEQNRERLFAEIKAAGRDVCRVAPVRVRPGYLAKSHMGAIGVCPVCGEAYPTADGAICRGCAGEAPYAVEDTRPRLRAVPVGEAAGRRVLHDMAELINHGRLGGTGYLSILPVDQGIEHSAGASFAPNPAYFDPENIVKLAMGALRRTQCPSPGPIFLSRQRPL